jgi:hypothetical protein
LRACYGARMTRGGWGEIDTGTSWEKVTAGTVCGDRLVVAADGMLYTLRTDGGWEQLGEESWKPRSLAAAAGTLVSVEEGGAMYRIDPAGGSFSMLSSSWGNTQHLCGHGAHVFAVDGTSLYRIDPIADTFEELGDGGWTDVRVIVSTGDALVIILASGAMYRVSAEDGSYVQLESGWENVTAAAGHAGRLYALADGQLYDVDAGGEGAYETIDTDTSWTATLLEEIGGALYALDRGSFYRIEL